MGNQVVVSFLTDHWHEIRKEPKKFVGAIDVLLSYGSESLVEEARSMDSGRPPITARMKEKHWADRNYVTVHRFRHADEPQITFTQRNSSWDVSDLTHGIRRGVLRRKSNRDTWRRIARGIVQQLRDQADDLEQAIGDDIRDEALVPNPRHIPPPD